MDTIAEFFIAEDAAFAAVTGPDARLRRVIGTDAHEGPVYVPHEDALYFTTVPVADDTTSASTPHVAIKRLALDGDRFDLEPDRVTTIAAEATMANGMTTDREGRLVICEQGDPSGEARISRLDLLTGSLTTVVDELDGMRFNSPNDVAVSDDGAIWFTDPSYGYLQHFRPEPVLGDFVYRVDAATGRAAVVADGFDKPNGIALSPDGAVLYVTDSGADQAAGSFDPTRPHHIEAFDVSGRHLTNRRLFAVTTPGIPDGLEVDADGRVYASAATGVQVFSPEGDRLGEIRLPGAVNFAFGGSDLNVLFITTDTAVWAAVLAVCGPRTAATTVLTTGV